MRRSATPNTSKAKTRRPDLKTNLKSLQRKAIARNTVDDDNAARVKTEPVERGRKLKAPDMVAAHIRKMIISGELKEGDFLKLESELTASFKVSRPTIREAFRTLEADQLISVVRGSRQGARIHKPSVAAVARAAGFALQADGATLGELYEARLAIEPFVARSLAQSPDKTSALRRLRRIIDDGYDLIEEGRVEEFRVNVARFHLTLVEAARNRMLTLVLHVVEDFLEGHQRRYAIDRLAEGEEAQQVAMQGGLRGMERLLKLIEQGDAAAAETYWREFLVAANASWLRGYESVTLADILD